MNIYKRIKISRTQNSSGSSGHRPWSVVSGQSLKNLAHTAALSLRGNQKQSKLICSQNVSATRTHFAVFRFLSFFGIICCNLWVRWCCKFSAATATALSSCRSNNFGYRLLQVGRPNEVRAAACQSQVESTSTSTSQSGLTDD